MRKGVAYVGYRLQIGIANQFNTVRQQYIGIGKPMGRALALL
jgi:hypothetical protein